MQCIEVTEPGASKVLKLTKRFRPVPQLHEVLIHVAAAGVNRPDILQRRGLYQQPPGASDLLGLEVSGRVVAVGKYVSEFVIGDEVCALTPGGGYSEYCIVSEAQCLPVPHGISMIEAAALPETFFTVWFNVFMQGKLGREQILLVHGGSSGIGTAAIQLAKAFGARVITTAGSQVKCDACIALGADIAINYKQQDFESVILQYTDKIGVDLILDFIGGEYVNKNIRILKNGGRLVNLYFLQGNPTEIDLMPMLVKNLTITGSLLRPQPISIKRSIRDELKKFVWPKIENGQINANVYQNFMLQEAKYAHDLMESNQHIGKLVLVNPLYL